MLTAYLNNTPYSKFVLIEDDCKNSSKNFVRFIINQHTFKDSSGIHYFICENNSESKRLQHSNSNITYYDYSNDSRGWLDHNNKKDFLKTFSELNLHESVVVIDSLAHLIHEYGLVNIYKCLQKALIHNKGLVRLVAILHTDLFDERTCETVCACLEHLSTFTISLEPNLNLKNTRVTFVYTKTSGKVIKGVEQYRFENGILITEPIKKIDPKVLVQENLNQVQPETLTTFKIGLNQKEKESRSKVVLPYLPKDGDSLEGITAGIKVGDGQIFYKFDEVDDWDEEDPDDDLDI